MHRTDELMLQQTQQMTDDVRRSAYVGRLAPSPTGYLHLGHARTFWIAQERARQAGGRLILRIEDLDPDRCRPEFDAAIVEDLRWFGLDWDEGPDVGGPHQPYRQGDRRRVYMAAWERLRDLGLIYPCHCSRREILAAAQAPHSEEPVYPGTCRPEDQRVFEEKKPGGMTWRFRAPKGEALEFVDGFHGIQRAMAGRDFGDFVVWRRDDVPAYHLAVVADDAAMEITEVVRGEDLLLSTFRQLLLYRALDRTPPAFYHCPLVCDEDGCRLAKRHASLSLRALREEGRSPQRIREEWDARVVPS